MDSDLINNDSGEGGALMVKFSSEAQLTNTVVKAMSLRCPVPYRSSVAVL